MVGKPWYDGDCVLCKEDCCNNDLHDILNSLLSFQYVAKQLIKEKHKYGERLQADVDRVDNALKNCKRRADEGLSKKTD